MWIPELLRAARREAGLTQRALAQRAGVPQSTVARIEAGKLNPRIDTLSRIVQAMGHELTIRRGDEGVDRSLIREMLELAPTERVRYAAAGGEAVERLRDAVGTSLGR